MIEDKRLLLLEALVSHFANAVDNLGDLPINEDWAEAWATKGSALLEELRQTSSSVWQPMDTAPKDQHILLYGKYWSDGQGDFPFPLHGMWNPNRERWEANFNGWFGVRPTHWMPLPAKPGADHD